MRLHRPSAAERMTQRRSLDPGPDFLELPVPTGEPPYRIDLTERIGPVGENLRFHAVGDTGGHRDARPQRRVAAAMAADPARFLLLLGDVVYPHGEAENYPAQFARAYADLPGPIFAVPGNHDAENGLRSGELALAPFLAHFGVGAAPGDDRGRPSARQPHVFFTLQHPFVWIVGLWANRPEGGQFAADQIDWLIGELRDAPADTPLIVALHQPVLSADVTHGSNLALLDLLDACAQEAGRGPDAVFSGHAHLYERFSAPLAGRGVPLVVAGAGGHPELHSLAAGVGSLPATFPRLPGVSLEACADDTHGFLTVTARPGGAEVLYTTVGRTGPRRVDVFAVNPPGR